MKVSGYDGPVKGLRLKLTPGADNRARVAVTDGSGIARFYNVAWGTQYLAADPDNGFGEQLEVQPSGPAGVIVPMRWPSIEPIHVRSLSGAMRAPGVIPGEAEQPVLSLELLVGISGRILSSKNTSSSGEFDFGLRNPGIYFIGVKGHSGFNQQIEGLISLRLDPAAPSRADRLDLDLTWTSCGLMYIDQRSCLQPDLHVKKLEGHVSDSHGEPVRSGVLVLLDAARTQVARVSPDRDGDFSFPDPLAGTFELWMGLGGFSPVHTQLHIEPSASSSSVEVEAGPYLGACTVVRTK